MHMDWFPVVYSPVDRLPDLQTRMESQVNPIESYRVCEVL